MDVNKLGFYIQVSQGVHDFITAIRPPVILLHAWDQGLLEEIRRFRSPETLVIGRMDYVRFNGQQVPVKDLTEGWLTQGDAEANGRAFAGHILEDNFRLAQRAEGGRRLVDAWMSLNECVPGPGSRAYVEGSPTQRGEIEAKLGAYDRFQFGFRSRLMEHGIEAVAFNFGAGNFGTPEHYTHFFPLTLSTYSYLGFHEYGWPALTKDVDPDAESSAGTYSDIVRALREMYGRDYKVIITEAGLARLYRHPDQPGTGDVGWLYPGEAVSQEKYQASLDWYNRQLNRDDFVLGACLYQVGHAGKWATFRHIGQDNEGRPIDILKWVEGLARGAGASHPQAAVPRMGDSVGLDANRPLRDDGSLADQVASPGIIAGSGAGWVRLNFVLGPWESVTDQNRHAGRTWQEAYRTLIDGFRQQGLRIYGLISNEAVRVQGQDINTAFRQAPPAGALSHPWIDRYVATFVEILKMFGPSLTAVESFNEPDGWHGGDRNLVHPHWFALMLHHVYHEVRKHPELNHIRLVSGPVEGTAANQNGGPLSYLPAVLAFGRNSLGWGQAGQPFPFDGIGYHMYVEENLNRDWQVHRQAIRSTYERYLGQMREAIRRGTGRTDLPLYVSEMGWYTNKGPEDRQADCLPFALESLVTGPWRVALAVVFCTQDFGDENTLKWYGLYRPGPLTESGKKPAHEAVRLFCQRARAGQPAPPAGGGTPPAPPKPPPAPMPGGVTNQQVINAFYAVIKAFGLPGWTLMSQAGLSLGALAKNPKALYNGPDLATAPNLTAEQRAMLLARLGRAAPAAAALAAGGFLIGRPELTTGVEMLPQELGLPADAAGDAVQRRVVRIWNRWGGLLAGVAAELGIERALAVGVLALSARYPAYDGAGRLRIRFDVQDFLLRSPAGAAEADGRLRVDPSRPWLRQEWRADEAAAWRKVHAGQDEEWAAFTLARGLDADAACCATGMGITGIMGFNHDLLGYASAEQMLRSLACSERMQVFGLFDFIATPGRDSPALRALRAGDLETFAARHAGPGEVARMAAELRGAAAFFRQHDPLA